MAAMAERSKASTESSELFRRASLLIGGASGCIAELWGPQVRILLAATPC